MDASVTWDVSPEAWREFVAHGTQATFFHSPGWYLTHAAMGGYSLATARFDFADGVTALLPMATVRRFRGLLRQAQAGVECGYGGLVSQEPLTHAHIRAAYQRVQARYADLQVTGNPHAAWEGALFPGDTSPIVTQLVPVLPRETQLKQMASTRAARVRKAGKLGFELTVIQAPSEDDVERFYPLYAAHASYWQYTRWVRDEAYFRTLFRHAAPELVLFLVHLDGELAAFRLLGVTGRTGLGLHLATTERHSRLDVGPYLIAETLAWCHDHGVGVFDFLPSGPLEGVSAYKSSFGGREAPFLAATCQSWLGRGLHAAWKRWRPASEPGLSTAAAAT